MWLLKSPCRSIGKRWFEPFEGLQNQNELCIFFQVEVAARKAELLRAIRGQLEEKDYGGTGQATGGISVSLRFTCGKVDHTFPSTCSVKVR